MSIQPPDTIQTLFCCFESGGWDASDQLMLITSDITTTNAFLRQNTKHDPHRFRVEHWEFDGLHGNHLGDYTLKERQKPYIR